ncbi:TPA: hypothetical protein ACRT47_001928, partial [Campylobacter jejuni]|nr:hypothetical protein [Campylobacter jejuni]HED8094433.1 hypothetical protein [Campylobacter jejuni]
MFKIDISQHINILKKYQNYKVEYDINQFNCSVSRIIRSIREKKHSELLKFWNQRSLIDTFELEHPYYNFIKTRAVKNFHKGIINCVLMIDENKKNPWIFMQIIDKAMNGFVTKEQFVWFAGNSVQERSCVDFLLQVLKKNEEIDNLNKSFSFLMNTDRPFPFFVTIANNFLFLKNKKLKNQKIFFDFEDAYENNNSVAIYPGTLHPEILDYNTMPIFNYVYQKSLLRKKFLINDAKKYQLKIWLGIPGERREWINWEYDIILLLLELLRYFQSIQIYLDGLTSLNGVKEFFLENENICNKLNEYFKINKLRCNFFSVAGCDYATKVSYCSNVDMAISDIGTTVLIPINFCQKRTVLFGLKKQFSIEFSTYYQKFIKDLNLKVNDFLYIKSNKEHSSWYFINS